MEHITELKSYSCDVCGRDIEGNAPLTRWDYGEQRNFCSNECLRAFETFAHMLKLYSGRLRRIMLEIANTEVSNRVFDLQLKVDEEFADISRDIDDLRERKKYASN